MRPELLLCCRAGFEKECAAEIQSRTAALDVSGFCRVKDNSGYVVFNYHDTQQTSTLLQHLTLRELIFTRQWFHVVDFFNQLSTEDRVSPIIVAIIESGLAFSDMLFETPDTNDAKELSPLCRKIEGPFKKQLAKAGRLDQASPNRLHVFFLSTCAAFVGYSQTNNDSEWAGGVPRLRFPSQAPSRSTLKLEEAFLRFLPHSEQEQYLKPGMVAVDLGAAPGGWTWQLVRRGMKVYAVDNGPMDSAVMDSGLVTHTQMDGFRYTPQAPVDWMVCDIVEQPIRIAQLAAKWLQAGWCKNTIFNLKLPMKKRHEEVTRCLDLIHSELTKETINYQLVAKQLYHDREEITVYIRRQNPSRRL